jgi:hypothetical protein
MERVMREEGKKREWKGVTERGPLGRDKSQQGGEVTERG